LPKEDFIKRSLSSQRLAQKVAGFADEIKAQEIVILDMRALVNFCDFFVIASGTSDRQVKAIAEGIEERLQEEGIAVHLRRSLKAIASVEYSQENGAWVILDMGDVVAHIFESRAREFYGLEHLWQDAPKIENKAGRKKK
jgi:ribosome-associated protein